jgi:hypothetical protein
MLQTDRNWLFNEAYRLDNLTRIWLPKEVIVVPVDRLEKLRIQEKTAKLGIVFTEAQLAALAESLRNLAANDEDRIVHHDRHRSNR